jgi:DNA-binding NarL/FixJ family response regulator
MVSEDRSKIPVLVVDHDAFARQGIKALVDAQPDMEVVGEASDCDETLELVKTTRARVVITEARITGRHCSELMDDLRRQEQPVGLIVLTDSGQGEDVLSAVRAGAAAYLRKSCLPAEVVDAVRVVADGGHVLEPCALDVVLRDYSARSHRTDHEKTNALSHREREVLTHIAEGRSTREIATDLGLSHKTVEVHRSRIMNKLQLHKAAHLVRYAVREGLVSLD